MRVRKTAACRFSSDGFLRERLSGEVEAELRQAVEATPSVKQLNCNLLIDQTDEGLCIQIADKKSAAIHAITIRAGAL